jgi:ubiquinone/menaquinone biosynthesis C-methylase UbiE
MGEKMKTQLHHYIIDGGIKGSDRLKVLSHATWPFSKDFLIKAGIQKSVDVLDLGCGNGENTLKIAAIKTTHGSLTGIDADPTNIEIARKESESKQISANWINLNLETEFPREQKYDFIYLRFLISHVTDTKKLLSNAKSILKPGGVIAIEDVDFDGHFCHPPCQSFDRYVELYKKSGQLRGADPLIGPKIPELLNIAGFSNPQFSVALPVFMEGDGKLMALLTLNNIQSAIISSKLINEAELQKITEELEAFTADQKSMMSLPRIFQVWARNE